MKIRVVGSLMLCFLTACSSPFASNGEQLYLRSKNGPGLVVSPPLTDINISHFYDLPRQDKKHPEVSIEPPFVSSTEAA